jgi:hypothetical protein
MDNPQVKLGDTRSSEENTTPKPSVLPVIDYVTKKLDGAYPPSLGLHPSTDDSIISHSSVGSPCSTDLLYPLAPHGHDDHPSFSSTLDDSTSRAISKKIYERRRRRHKAQITSECDEIQTWSHQWPLLGTTLSNHLLHDSLIQKFRTLERHSCPNINYQPNQNQPCNSATKPSRSSPTTWVGPVPVKDEVVSMKQFDQRAAGTRKRRWTLPHKARPSRAISRASNASGTPTPINENSRIVEGEVDLGSESLQRPKKHELGHNRTSTKKRSNASHPHVDTPAMITLRRASTRIQDSRVTLLSQIIPTEEQVRLLKPPEAPQIGAYFSRSYHPRVSPNNRDQQALRLLPQKSRLAEPATTIAELQITQKPLDESALSELELRRRKSGYAKIFSGRTFHEVIWEDYTSSSSTSSKSCQSENCVLRSANEFQKSTGAEVRRFSLPHLPLTLIDQLKDAHIGPPKRSDSVLIRRQSFAELLTLTMPLQKMLTWPWKGREATESILQYASTTQTRRPSLSCIPRRVTDPFATVLEDNGYTAAVDRVEFFPPLESRRESLTWLAAGAANLDDSCVGQSEEGSKSAPKLSPFSFGSLAPLDEAPASEFKLTFQNPQWNTLVPSPPDISQSRKQSSLQPRLSMGHALGSSSHKRKKSKDVHKGRFEASRNKGKSSDALVSLSTKGPPKHPALVGLPKRSKSDLGEPFGRRAKSLDLSSRAYTMMDLLSPVRYMHQLAQRRRSSGPGGLREASLASFQGTLLSPTEEFPPTDQISCSGDACTPVSVDWIG